MHDKLADKYAIEKLVNDYNELTDKIAELREKYLPTQWLDSISPYALGEVVASPLSVLEYLDKYMGDFLK